MNRDVESLAYVQRLVGCARRLRQQWPRADALSIDETALELWGDERLREISGEKAAALWLQPLQCGCGCKSGAAASSQTASQEVSLSRSRSGTAVGWLAPVDLEV